LRDGDCGLWVVDSQTYEVFGHVVASNIFGEAYVVPLDDLFENIKHQLGAQSVGLPQAHEASSWLYGAPGRPLELSSLQAKDSTQQKTRIRSQSIALTDDGYFSMSECGISTSSGSAFPDHREDFSSTSIPTSFGGSVCDFEAAIELVASLTNTLRDINVSKKEYRMTVAQLSSLETALLQVKRLEFDENFAELIALRHTASQCHRAIYGFCDQVLKQHGIAGWDRGLSVIRSFPMDRSIGKKAHWDRISKSDLEHFSADLLGHTASINLLLATVSL
jgi:hypothetical protein